MIRLRIKPVDTFSRIETSGRLPRRLGCLDMLSLGVGCTVGMAIFVLTGGGAAEYAGPALMISFVMGAITCCFVAVMYDELAALVPVAGSAYTYTHATLGEAAAWMVGWSLMLEYWLASGAIAAGWSAYLGAALKSAGWKLPDIWTEVPSRGGI